MNKKKYDYMKKFLILTAALMFLGGYAWNASAASAPSPEEEQEETFKKERRIFLWDVTISMVGATQNSSCPKAQKRTNPDYAYNEGFPNYNAGKDIFDETRDKLVKMIYQIQNESTEIIVLPFRDGIVGEFKANATATGKEQLKGQIMNWNDLHSGGTFTATCLKDAVNKYFTKDKINRLFLLTDGEPSGNEGSQLLSYIKNWRGIKETKGSSSYLVYVMLTDEAYNEDIVEVGKNSGGDITVTKNFNEPVWLTIGHSTSIHVRDFLDGKISNNGKGSFEVPYTFITGNQIPENSVFHFAVEENDYLTIDPSAQVRPSDGKFTVPFSLKQDLAYCLANLPQAYNLVLTATCTKDPNSNENITITGSNVVEIALVIKSEPRVKISWSVKNKEE